MFISKTHKNAFYPYEIEPNKFELYSNEDIKICGNTFELIKTGIKIALQSDYKIIILNENDMYLKTFCQLNNHDYEELADLKLTLYNLNCKDCILKKGQVYATLYLINTKNNLDINYQ